MMLVHPPRSTIEVSAKAAQQQTGPPMLISVEKRFFFVANTKTASTSIEHALLPYADLYRGGTPARKHINLYNAMKTYPFLFEQKGYEFWRYFRFGVMRDPLDWISSWYRYRRGNQVQSPLPADMDFAGFWQAKDWNIVRPNGLRHLQRQMFCGPKDKVLADLIIPYDQVEPMFARVCEGLRIPAPLPRKNVSNLQTESVIPNHLVDEVRAFYAEDYALWDTLDEINKKGMEKLAERGNFKT